MLWNCGIVLDLFEFLMGEVVGEVRLRKSYL